MISMVIMARMVVMIGVIIMIRVIVVVRVIGVVGVADLFIVMLFGEVDHIDAVGRHNNWPFVARSLDQPVHPAFKPKTVHNHQVGLCQRPGMRWLGEKRMGIPVGADKRHQVDPVATHVRGHVAQDAKRGNDVQLLISLCGKRSPHTRRGSHTGQQDSSGGTD